jgi:D-glycero-D-manno-heptose 1,7-bisphosphate phosphatase
MSRIGIFLDRDGTINEEVDFLSDPKDLRLIPGAAEAIREANQLDAVVCVVTNQSGIARGLFNEEQLAVIHAALRAELERSGARLDAIYYCPHHASLGEGSYRTECSCRKPRTGMVDDAVREFGIDTKRSFVVGDRLLDIRLANAIGATAILVRTGYGSTELSRPVPPDAHIDYVAKDLYDAVHFIKRRVLHD